MYIFMINITTVSFSILLFQTKQNGKRKLYSKGEDNSRFSNVNILNLDYVLWIPKFFFSNVYGSFEFVYVGEAWEALRSSFYFNMQVGG